MQGEDEWRKGHNLKILFEEKRTPASAIASRDGSERGLTLATWQAVRVLSPVIIITCQEIPDEHSIQGCDRLPLIAKLPCARTGGAS